MVVSFRDLGLSDAVLEAIAAKGFEEPSQIQEKAIPLLLSSSSDVIVQAQTGTGKTATFGLVFTQTLTPQQKKTPQALVLSPTRELAIQIAEELNSLKGQKNFKIVPIYGGQSWGMQRDHLRSGVDIVVGTPGRIIDHLERGTLNIESLEYFVLDEADEMLNMGFIEDVEKILEKIKERKKMLLFSATMPKKIHDLAKKYMREPELIQTKSNQATSVAVDQIYFEVQRRDRFEALCRIIDMEEGFYGIIFCRTKIESDEVAKHLNDRGYRAEAFHGDITQERREQILKNFKNKGTEVLVATDVAARGIDVKDLTHVINYALPQNSESYVHRIGRTGRAGKKGKAITLITPDEYRKMRMFGQRTNTDIQKQYIPTGEHMVELKQKKILQELQSILDTSKGLGKYDSIVETLTEKHNVKNVLGALLHFSFSKILDIDSYTHINQIKKGAPDKPFSENRERSFHESNSFSPRTKGDSYGKARLFLTTGRNDKATPAKILQMIEKDFGVSHEYVGEIDIMQEYSFITVPLAQAEIILDAFYALKKKKRPSVRIERASDTKKSPRKKKRSSK